MISIGVPRELAISLNHRLFSEYDSSSKTEMDQALNTLILTATKQYLEEKALDQSGSYCIRLSVLTESGKLVEPITNSSGETINVSSIFYVKFPEAAGSEFVTSINESVSGLNCDKEILS